MRLLIALFAALSALSVAGCAEDETAPTAAPSATSTAVPPGPQADWKPSDDPKLAKFMGLVA
ncbi:MAG: hypothetical protein ACYSW1_02705, partial [Planctomycetota bacterium]